MILSEWATARRLRFPKGTAQWTINADCGEVRKERSTAADARRIGSLVRERDYTGLDASAWYKRYGELKLMRFEERELKPYAEPVPPEELKNGETYFAVLFLDDDGLVPTLEPLVFIGRDLDPGEEGKLYFQDYGSYRGGVRFETASPDDEAIFHTGREKGVYDYEHALDVLLACALRRRKK